MRRAPARRRAAARPRAAVRASTLPIATGAIAALLVVVLGVFHIWSRTRVVAAGYRLGALQAEHTKLTSEHDRLRIEVETLRAPRALEEFARNKLGMAPPDSGPVWAAGPRSASAGAGGAGVDGVDHRSGPAEPSLSTKAGRAAAGPAADSERVALRGPLRAGRSMPRER
ncbi:cell division protein FtsL [Anaeromyxobacter terrae]|uniref:cell division protein FtsL n=1 Tax=Anaeromyxobacter terrae TaxID=2925406 RepID=UPI001F5899B2|nr:cell division protein FtsL [Anaeromyxobacter sp. SG22]